MLYRVEIENYLSIRERQVLDLTIGEAVTDDSDRFAPLFPGATERAPKVVAFYGANASGKTTVLKALDNLSRFVRSMPDSPETFVLGTFADQESSDKPISIAIEFGGIVNFTTPHDNPGYKLADVGHGLLRYEIEFEVGDGLARRVRHEALRQKPNGKGRWMRIFERDLYGEVTGSEYFKLTNYRHLQSTLHPLASVLASYAFFQHPAAQMYSRAVSGMSQSNLTTAKAFAEDDFLFEFLHRQPEVLRAVNDSLSRIDAGVEGLVVEPHHGKYRPRFRHSGLHMELGWDWESQGTKAFVKLFPLLHLVLNLGGLALIDEFDTLLHPIVLPEILRWFYDKADRNHSDAQLWMTCHSATLLEDLVKEEVVIVEKDRMGRTSLYSLMDVKATRRDDNLYKKYLGGVYGGIPVIG